MNPAVSILLPVRNEEDTLPAALLSISRQTLSEWELVAVDDHSTDGTAAILEEAARRDPRVRVVRSERPGLVNALNAGLEECRGQLVARMDGDDVAHPKRLELQANFLTLNPEVSLAAARFRHFPRRELKVGMAAYEEWQNRLLSHEEILRDLFVESPFVHPSVMYRRDAVRALGGYRDAGWAEDYDLWLRMAAEGLRFARLPEVLLFWRDRPRRATRTMAEYRLEAFRACKAHHLRRGFLRDVNEVVLVGAGIEGRAWRRTLEAEGLRTVLWIDADPRKRGRLLHGARVAGPQEELPQGMKCLVTIGTRGAREQVRRWGAERGLREGEDFLCVT